MADVEEGIGVAEKAPASSLARHRGYIRKSPIAPSTSQTKHASWCAGLWPRAQACHKDRKKNINSLELRF